MQLHMLKLLRTHSKTQQQNTPAESLLKKSLFAFILAIIGYGLTYGLNILLARSLSQEAFGDYSLILSVAAFFGAFILLGNGEASARFLTTYLKSNSWPEANGIIHFYRRFAISISIVVLLISVFSLITDARLASTLAPHSLVLRHIWLILLFALLSFYTALLQSVQRYYFAILAYNVLPGFIMLLVIGYWHLTGHTISLYFALHVLAYALIILIILELFRFRSSLPPDVWQAQPVYHHREWLLTGCQIMISTMILVYDQAITTMTLKSSMHNASASVGLFAAICTLTNLMWISAIACGSVLGPRISPAAHANNKAALQKITNTGNLIMLSAGLLLFLVFVFFGKTLLGHFGAAYVKGYHDLLIVAFGNLVNLSCGMSLELLEFAASTKLLVKITLWSAVFVFTIGGLLCHYFGVHGASLMLSITEIGFAMVYVVIVKTKLDIKPFGIF